MFLEDGAMNISVVAISDRKSEKQREIAKVVADEFVRSGHSVERMDAADFRLASSLFIVIISEPKGLGSGLGEKIRTELAQCQNLVGKRAMALLCKSGFFPSKALSLLMKSLEKEGMIVTMGEIVGSAAEAIAAARGAPLVKGENLRS